MHKKETQSDSPRKRADGTVDEAMEPGDLEQKIRAVGLWVYDTKYLAVFTLLFSVLLNLDPI